MKRGLTTSRNATARTARRLGILPFAAAVIGASILFYPAAATWLSDWTQADSLGTYARIVEAQTPKLLADARDEAHAFNAQLPRGQLRDPFAAGVRAEATRSDYDRTLQTPGTEVIAHLSIPAIDVSLPVYHGVGDRALDRGVGHLPGSSLPVGGPGTHAVLSAHSGLATAVMLTDLEKMRKGDSFQITVLGEVLTYRVDQILVVKPSESDVLRIEDGKDYVTLLTCTPVNVNTHRLLVRGERVPDGAGADRPRVAVPQPDPEFPWWLVGYLTVIGLSAVVTLAPLSTRRRDKTE